MYTTLHSAAYVKNKTNDNKHLMMAICQYAFINKKLNLIKMCGPCCEENVKSKVAAKKWL